MTDVFISYSRKDIAFARLVHQALLENDLETWIDWQDTRQLEDWALICGVRNDRSAE